MSVPRPATKNALAAVAANFAQSFRQKHPLDPFFLLRASEPFHAQRATVPSGPRAGSCAVFSSLHAPPERRHRFSHRAYYRDTNPTQEHAPRATNTSQLPSTTAELVESLLASKARAQSMNAIRQQGRDWRTNKLPMMLPEAKLSQFPLVWIDCEMTGLDINSDRIIEIAVVITDGNLNLVASGPDLIINQSKQLLDGMNEWCKDHHGRSGLTAAALRSKITTQDATRRVLDFVKQHIPRPNSAILAGNSVHVDKEFLKKEMPELIDHLHYRLIDVSTVKELVRRWAPDVADAIPSKGMSHRALDDIRESIQELAYYRSKIFGHATPSTPGLANARE